MRLPLILCAATLVPLIGCGGEDPPTIKPPDNGDFEAPPPPENGTQVVLSRFTLAAGEEVESCRFLKAPNLAAGVVVRMEMVARQGIHHAFVSQLTKKYVDHEVGCSGIPEEVMTDGGIPQPIFASSTQVAKETIAFPEGVGVRMGEQQQLVFNYHYVNTGDEPIEAEVYLNLHFADPGQTDGIEEAQFYAFGNITDIAIPAHGSQTLTRTCTFPEAAKVVTMTPHMHQLGREFRVARYDGNAAQETLMDTQGWENPETHVFDTPLALNAGEGLTITCGWDNPGDSEVNFGLTSNDEMCFAFGFFYPGTGQFIDPQCE